MGVSELAVMVDFSGQIGVGFVCRFQDNLRGETGSAIAWK